METDPQVKDTIWFWVLIVDHLAGWSETGYFPQWKRLKRSFDLAEGVVAPFLFVPEVHSTMVDPIPARPSFLCNLCGRNFMS